MEMYLVAVGTVKSPELRALIADYTKRISAYCTFHLIEAKEITAYTPKENLAREAREITSLLPKNTYLIALASEGKSYDSFAFARAIEAHYAHDSRPITFLIGSSDGIDLSLKKSASALVSFSSFTFPHQLMRLIACEQIYRAFTIIHHQKYHK